MCVIRILLALALICMPSQVWAEKRVALVIGNSAYQHAPGLTNPTNDADDMARKLESLGFEVVAGKDLDLNGMRRTIRDFVDRLDGPKLAVFYYSGHGLQVDGVNYLVPIDAQLARQSHLDFETLPMDLILSAMERSSATNLIFLDACRDNPLARNLAQSMGTKSVIVGQGLAKVGSGVGTLISFATQPGAVAFDGADRNSPYTGALLRHLGTPGEDISRELIYVRRDVLKATDGKQVPWDSSSLTGEVVLRPLGVEISHAETTRAEQPILSNQAVELSYRESIRDATEPSFFEAYLREYPDGAFATLAKLKLETLAKRAEPDQRSKSEHVAMAPPSPEIGAGNEEVLKQSNASRFDGTWKLTRRATNPSCGWRALSDVLTIKEGKIIAGHFEGKVSRDGSVQITHRFIDHGRTEFNELRGKIKGSTGTGKFVHIGGSCAGTIEISRMR